MASLAERMMKAGVVKETNLVSESKFFNNKEMVDIGIPALNIAFSAMVDGGLTPGVTVWAGKSKTFKSLGTLLCAAAYQRKYPDGIVILYDTEFGITPDYLRSLGVDTTRVVHVPIETVEVLKFDMFDRLESIEKGDKVLFVIDSIGNMASKKEVEDARDGKSVADMTRAKALKSFFRLITAKLTILELNCIAINHTYDDIGGNSHAEIIGGGCLVPGTEIMMSDGTTKAIEDVTIGDLVSTVEGPKPVINTWNPETLVEGTPECFEVEFDDGTKVICSEGHKFFRNGEWIEASDLVVGDELATIT